MCVYRIQHERTHTQPVAVVFSVHQFGHRCFSSLDFPQHVQNGGKYNVYFSYSKCWPKFHFYSETNYRLWLTLFAYACSSNQFLISIHFMHQTSVPTNMPIHHIYLLIVIYVFHCTNSRVCGKIVVEFKLYVLSQARMPKHKNSINILFVTK